MAGPSTAVPVTLFIVTTGFSALYSGSFDAILLIVFSLARHVYALVENHGTSFFLKAAGATITALLIFKGFQARWTAVDTRQWGGPGKVLILPCRTTHSRMFPKKHSFSYSYLAVGVPVDWEGNAGGMVSVGIGSKSGLSSWFSLAPRVQQGWYTIDAGDYLERGNSKLGLRGKLDAYLRGQVADPTLYPHAYLITAARFLGYHFNPVSFWYLYDAEKSLAAMILEVNNTFGERRMYFLTSDDNDELVKQINGLPGSRTEKEQLVTNMRQSAPSGATFKQSWPKDFHVSPFNSRKGSYSLTASDPLSPLMQGTGPVVNTINLVSSKGRGKLVARLIPEGAAIDPYTMTPYGKFRFLASWWWVGFLTFPRIVKEAGALFLRRKLHVWFRPEPLKESIGRNADATELQLEPIFRRYLRHLVEQSAVPLAVKYIPSGVPGIATELMISQPAQDGKGIADEIVFKVLTPAFYSRFVHYAYDFEAVFCELQESCTIWLSRPELLPRFVLKKASPTLTSSNYAEFAYFKILQCLRVRPERIVRPLTSSAAGSEGGPERLAVDIRNFHISSMDAYVLAHETGQAKAVYRSCVLKLFIADRIALGMVPLLELERLTLQTWFAWRLSSIVVPVLAGLSHNVSGSPTG